MRQYLVLVFVSVLIFAFFFTYEPQITVEEDQQVEISGIIRRVKNKAEGYDVYIDDILIKHNLEEMPVEGYVGIYKGKQRDINYFSEKYQDKSYTNYLKSQGINYIVYPKEFQTLPQTNIYYIRSRFSNKMEEVLDQMYRGDSPLLKALLYGDNSEIDQDIRKSFSRTGTSHILALSGFHTGIILVMINFLFARIPVRTRGLLGILILVTYSFLTGMRPSIIRATLFFGIYFMSFIFTKKFNVISAALLVASIFIALNPYIIYDLGFVLSFVSVISITVFMPVLKDLKIKGLLSVTLSAQILVMPIVAYNFNIIPVVGLLANLIVVPIIGLMMGILIVSVAFYVAPFSNLLRLFSDATIATTILLKNLAININKVFENLPLAYIENVEIGIFHIIFYYAIILFAYTTWLNYKIEVNHYEIKHLKRFVIKE